MTKITLIIFCWFLKKKKLPVLARGQVTEFAVFTHVNLALRLKAEEDYKNGAILSPRSHNRNLITYNFF
jgi:hypothetical protein